jgi:peptidoglycan/LPS O-acetylase OafA/YrhL
MLRRRQSGTVGLGYLGVNVFVVLGAYVLWNHWDKLPEWAAVILLMFWGAAALFGGIIALGIDSKNDSEKS